MFVDMKSIDLVLYVSYFKDELEEPQPSTLYMQLAPDAYWVS